MSAALLPPSRRRALWAVVAAGAVVGLTGLALAPTRALANLLVGALYVTGIALGGLAFVAFGYVTRAGWHVAFRRVPEALAGTLPYAAALVLAALAGLPLLYEWSHADAVAADPVLSGKRAWLDGGFFLVRAVAYLALWLLFARALRGVSRRQDESGDPAATGRATALSAAFLVVLAITLSLASFDWIMSLEPHWYSTVFGVYQFSGLFTATLAATTIFAVALRRAGPLRGVFRDDHLHELGKLTLGFATFWAYLWYCQYMLIWYGNMPEETVYFVVRQQGAWGPLLFLVPIVCWLVPFLVLLPRRTKRSESVMVAIAVLLLAGHWLDLYVCVLPPLSPEAPPFGLLEIALPAAAVAGGVLVFVRVLGRARLVPVRDPMLVESLHHHA